MRCFKGDFKCGATTGKCNDIQKNKLESTDGGGQVAVTQSLFPVISFSTIPESLTAVLMIWLAKLWFSHSVWVSWVRRLFPHGMLHKQYVQTMKKLSVCGVVSVINEALHGTTARSCGQPNVRVWLSTTSSVKARTKRLCERALSQKSH